MRCGGFGGVSRAAKGADCKSAGYAFAGSSPASPTTLKIKKKIENELLERSDFHIAYVAKYSPIISTVANLVLAAPRDMLAT
jgi:hypothetical protein